MTVITWYMHGGTHVVPLPPNRPPRKPNGWGASSSSSSSSSSLTGAFLAAAGVGAAFLAAAGGAARGALASTWMDLQFQVTIHEAKEQHRLHQQRAQGSHPWATSGRSQVSCCRLTGKCSHSARAQ